MSLGFPVGYSAPDRAQLVDPGADPGARLHR